MPPWCGREKFHGRSAWRRQDDPAAVDGVVVVVAVVEIVVVEVAVVGIAAVVE